MIIQSFQLVDIKLLYPSWNGLDIEALMCKLGVGIFKKACNVSKGFVLHGAETVDIITLHDGNHQITVSDEQKDHHLVDKEQTSTPLPAA